MRQNPRDDCFPRKCMLRFRTHALLSRRSTRSLEIQANARFARSLRICVRNHGCFLWRFLIIMPLENAFRFA